MNYIAPPHGFRTFVIVWLTQSLSVMGSALTVFAVNIYLAQVWSVRRLIAQFNERLQSHLRIA